MPIYDLVIKILRLLSDTFFDVQECIYQKRNYLDKSLSMIDSKNLKESIDSIDKSFYNCFNPKNHAKVKSLIYTECLIYLKTNHST